MIKQVLFASGLLLTQLVSAQTNKIDNSLLGGLNFRAIGPAVASGRISDLAINPTNFNEYYIAAASGGVWKTSNGGTTFEAIFDNQSSFSIGCLALDPNNPNVLWVGTGENNGQRSVAYGDGVYKSDDGGKSFKKMGLPNSEHIGKILIDPRNSNVVYVAAQGPLWSNGGDRGLYKTTDGGKTWKKCLDISQYTGVSDIAFDPRNPDVIYASSWQRRRHVYTFIAGGPESKVYKSTDAGATWDTIENGLPTGDKGRIALAVSTVNPDIVYCMIEAANKKGGTFKSSNRGASWEKQSDYATSSNYYQELFPDPKDENTLYAMDTYAQISKDGGKTWKALGERYKHVDNHAIWINPTNTKHLLVGCDGGLYETKDGAATWNYKPNLNITQFYRVTVDNSFPFYNVYGGTQDNTTLGGPSRTTNNAGITNDDWFVTTGGDGFKTQVDPSDPNIVYSQSQYGGLVRFDKRTGEQVGIKPLEGKDQKALRWNWDSPLIISPHNPARLYFAANVLYQSDDRGSSWKMISGDLTQQIDRNKIPVMDKVWSVDAVAKNQSTSIYGNIVALDESPKKVGLLYVGTDDGLIQTTENNGQSWRKSSMFPGITQNTYVNYLVASQHNENVVYAVFNNHKNGDFKPYILKSSNKGVSWLPINSNLPARGSVYCIAEDHIDPNLLFCGTEFGVYFSNDGGSSWTALKNGLPTIAIKEIAIQKRENDLVLATFGRGFYVLDDYSYLRNLKTENLQKEAFIFPIKDAYSFIESRPLGLSGKGFMGESYFTTENPPVGTIINVYLKNDYQSIKEKRQKAEAELIKKNLAVAYPTIDELRAEDKDEAAYLLVNISDENKQLIRRIKTKASKGVQKVVWDFRYATASPASLAPADDNIFSDPDAGRMVAPGTYFASVDLVENGTVKNLHPHTPFNVKRLPVEGLVASDSQSKTAIENKAMRLQRAAAGANNYRAEMVNKLQLIKVAYLNSKAQDNGILSDIKTLGERLNQLNITLNGDATLARREFETAPSLLGRIDNVVYNLFYTTSTPTKSVLEQYQIAGELFTGLLQELKSLDTELKQLENKLENYEVPYTPGRLPNWKMD